MDASLERFVAKERRPAAHGSCRPGGAGAMPKSSDLEGSLCISVKGQHRRRGGRGALVSSRARDVQPVTRGGTRSGSWRVAEAQCHELLQQCLVAESQVRGGVGKILVAGNLRIGIGFQEVERSLLRQPVVE